MSKGKSVVVNYSEKPFLFNVSAGETVDRMQARLAESYSIPLDKQQLIISAPKGFQDVEPEVEVSPIEAKVDFYKEFNEQYFPFLPKIYHTVDYFILDLRPTLSSLLNRKVVLEYVKKTLSKCLGARAFCVGSSMNNVFLPDEMMEVTPFLCKGQEDKWVLRVNEGLCAAAFSSAEANAGVKNKQTSDEEKEDADVFVDSVTFDCKSACVLASINSLKVRISQNQLEALYNGALLEDINFICKKSSLFKKSLLLIKSWCSYDSKQFSPNGKTVFPDVLPSFVLDIMVVHIISRYGDTIDHPLHTLGLFLHFFASIDFSAVVITMTDLLCATTLEPIVDSELKDIKDKQLAHDINMKYRVLFNGYRHRYEATVSANKRAKEENLPCSENVQQNTDSSVVEEAVEKDKSTGISWGISSENPSRTVDYRPSPTPPCVSSNHGNFFQGEDNSEASFVRSHLNVIGPFKPNVNIASQLQASDIQELTSLLQCGLKRFERTLHVCRLSSTNASREVVDVGEGIEIPIESYFIGECFGLSRDKIIVEKKKHGEVNMSDADAIEELRMSKYYCEVETPEDVLRHAELIMGSKITADAVANLIVHIIEQMGPLPIGEIGKLLQEFTGNQNLSRILKSQFRGLKKLIEGYPSSLMVGGDHNFNPHVYLARSKDAPTTDAWVDEKKVSAHELNRNVLPPGLQVQHEQKYMAMQQQQKNAAKSSHAPPVSTRPAYSAGRDRRDDANSTFQLSASSPAYITPSSSQQVSWREMLNQQQHPARDPRLSSSYYLDERIEATETAFRSEQFRDAFNHPSARSDMDRGRFAPRNVPPRRAPDGNRPNMGYYQDPRSVPNDGSGGGGGNNVPPYMGMSQRAELQGVRLDEEYASGHFDSISPPPSGRYVQRNAEYSAGNNAMRGLSRDRRYPQGSSKHDSANVASIFGKEYQDFEGSSDRYYSNGNVNMDHESAARDGYNARYDANYSMQSRRPMHAMSDQDVDQESYFFQPKSSQHQREMTLDGEEERGGCCSKSYATSDHSLNESKMLPYFLREN